MGQTQGDFVTMRATNVHQTRENNPAVSMFEWWSPVPNQPAQLAFAWRRFSEADRPRTNMSRRNSAFIFLSTLYSVHSACAGTISGIPEVSDADTVVITGSKIRLLDMD